jgi:hypothetical protein
MVAVNDIVAAKLAPRLRELTFADYERIAALGSRYGLEIEGHKEWAHLWADNPVFQETPNWPMGWVFENEDHEIVGHIANIPLLYELGGQRLIVAASRAVVVDAGYRSYSFQLMNQFFRQKQVDLYLATTVNAQAVKAYEVFRAARVPTGTWDQTAFWITNYRGFSASLLAIKEIRGTWGLSYPLSAGLFLRDTLAGRLTKARCGDGEPSFCTDFDDRFEEFWHELRRNFPHLLLANRSRQALEWHFKHPLGSDRAWVLTVNKGTRLAAYAIFFRRDSASFRLKRMRLVDFQTLDGNAELLLPLLCHALARCRREGIHMLEAIGFPPDKQRVIDSLSPNWRKLESWLYFYKPANHQVGETLKDPQVWDPSCYDGDASL